MFLNILRTLHFVKERNLWILSLDKLCFHFSTDALAKSDGKSNGLRQKQ